MSPRPPHRWLLHLALAFASGAPGLVYEVVWTRQVALLVGSQVEAISVVLVAFFGGLALGAALLGRAADRVSRPLALYGLIEIAAGVLTLATPALVGVGGALEGISSDRARLATSAAVLFPIPLLLGGAVPALVRSAARSGDPLAHVSGRLLGANTAGAVLGVAVAVAAIPRVGLQATLWVGAWCAIAVGIVALMRSGVALPAPTPPRRRADAPLRPWVMAAAALAGMTTLAYEVLAARGATLQLGSSLLAWALVLGGLLAGLSSGSLLVARYAGSCARPNAVLGGLEGAAALLLAAAPIALLPELGADASGLRRGALLRVAAAILPVAVLLGAALPLFVRLAVPEDAPPGAGFGRVSAANTAGGVVGSLLAPFVLLPLLDLTGAMLACAAANALLAAVFLARDAPSRRRGLLRAFAVAGAVLAVGVLAPGARRAGDSLVLFSDDGAQASTVVVRRGAQRILLVDGEHEASTGGTARHTEELLAVLPLVLHPGPQQLLEVGLGSGITLATAARFDLERLECVEIAGSVLRAAPFFAPDNGALAADDPRVHIVRGDGRAYLAHHPGSYDVVVANTLHPWSVGATGLYSVEYFERLRGALRRGGIAVQWLPLEGMDAEGFGALLRTFFSVFPEGALWWGSDEVLAVGSELPLPQPSAADVARRLADAGLRPARLGLVDVDDLLSRRIAEASVVRRVLGEGMVLRDDRPSLENRRRGSRHGGLPVDVVVAIAKAGAADDPGGAALALYAEASAARRRGDAERAERRTALAAGAGLGLARLAQARTAVAEAGRELRAGRSERAAAHALLALERVPGDASARFALAAALAEGNGWDGARLSLETLLREHPDHAEGWNLLGVAHQREGDLEAAHDAFLEAIEADPYFPEALANAGLAALELGRPVEARGFLERLDSLFAGRDLPERRRLTAALGG